MVPPLVAASIKVFELLSESSALRDRLTENTRYFRAAMTAAGFDVVDLGIDVAPERFVQAIKEQQPQIVGLSGLLTLSVDAMAEGLAHPERLASVTRLTRLTCLERRMGPTTRSAGLPFRGPLDPLDRSGSEAA